MLIAGCGELGIAIAARLQSSAIYGLRRHTRALPPTLRPIAADLLSGAGLDALPAAIDTLIYAPTPSARTPAAYRAIYIDALNRLLEALPAPAANLRLLLVSSTAVYAQDCGEAVDESSLCAPQAFNGQLLLEAERRACAQVADTVRLRLSGLYGPGRHWLLRRVRAQEVIAAGCHWTNRIHLADAGALGALLAATAQVPNCVIGVDDTPAPEHEVLDWLAARLGLPPPPRSDSPATETGKRLCNHLSRSLGWQPRYASYRDGYADVLTSIPPGTTRS